VEDRAADTLAVVGETRTSERAHALHDPHGPARRFTVRAVIDTVGLLGVIGSLIFVGLQIRQNTRLARAEAYRAVEQTAVQWDFVAATDDELAPLLRGVTYEGLRRDQLSDPDKWRVGSMFDALLRSYESIYRQVQEDILPGSALDGFANDQFVSPYLKDLWPILRPNYRADFVEYFEDRFLGVR
jgi:hypothetical protein